MARWTVRRGDAIVDIEQVGELIKLDVSPVPAELDIAAAEDLRVKLGAAIGAARQPGTTR